MLPPNSTISHTMTHSFHLITTVTQRLIAAAEADGSVGFATAAGIDPQQQATGLNDVVLEAVECDGTSSLCSSSPSGMGCIFGQHTAVVPSLSPQMPTPEHRLHDVVANAIDFVQNKMPQRTPEMIGTASDESRLVQITVKQISKHYRPLFAQLSTSAWSMLGDGDDSDLESDYQLTPRQLYEPYIPPPNLIRTGLSYHLQREDNTPTDAVPYGCDVFFDGSVEFAWVCAEQQNVDNIIRNEIGDGHRHVTWAESPTSTSTSEPSSSDGQPANTVANTSTEMVKIVKEPVSILLKPATGVILQPGLLEDRQPTTQTFIPGTMPIGTTTAGSSSNPASTGAIPKRPNTGTTRNTPERASLSESDSMTSRHSSTTFPLTDARTQTDTRGNLLRPRTDRGITMQRPRSLDLECTRGMYSNQFTRATQFESEFVRDPISIIHRTPSTSSIPDNARRSPSPTPSSSRDSPSPDGRSMLNNDPENDIMPHILSARFAVNEHILTVWNQVICV